MPSTDSEMSGSYPPELLRVEENVKEKYIELVKNLSYVELKNFQKTDYAKMMVEDMKKLLPHFDKSRLKETAHYMSNALATVAKLQTKTSARQPNPPKNKVSAELSESVLKDLETTMLIENPVNDDAEDSDAVESEDETTSTGESSDRMELDDSVTQLKQPTSAENSTSDINVSDVKKTDEHKCCDSCSIKPKKKVPMIQCSLCMSWYHEKCVGITNDQPVGIWLCIICREVPKNICDEIVCLKADFVHLKQSTAQILSAVTALTNKMDESIGGINDRITALTRQINLHDITISGSVDNLASKTSDLKTITDQKTNKILNKTTAVFDKVKTWENNLKRNDVPEPQTTQSENNQKTNVNSESKPNMPASQNKKNKAPNNTKNKEQHNKNRTDQQTTKKSENQIQHQQKQSNARSDEQNEVIDLTTRKTKQVIRQDTLIIGSSILKNIKICELNDNTAVKTVRGATIDTLKAKLDDLEIDNCKTLIVHVGGNDAGGGEELGDFRDNFDSLLGTVNDGNRRVIVSELTPRDDANLEPYNEVLRSLCDDNEVEFVENYKSFLLATGELPLAFFHKDKLHINNAGTRKLLANIDKLHRVTRASAAPSQQHYKYQKRSGYQAFPNTKSHHPAAKFCHICSRTGNHNTQECWYNGRNDGFTYSGRNKGFTGRVR